MENNQTIKLLELFGGIGAPRKALENLGVNVKSIDYVENTYWAVIAYNYLYNHKQKQQSVVGWNLDVDIMVHGSPCQDFSIAGKGDVEHGGRSSLYTETLKIISEVLNPKPKVVIWENVKGLISKKHKHHFQHYLDQMELFGYNNYYKVLIATDFGIPQKRERIFTVSIRKDFDNQSFNFENLQKQQIKPLKSFLEPCVDIKYFLKQESMVKAVQKGEIRIVNNNEYITNSNKQWNWNDAGVVKIPLTTFNAENYIRNTYNPVGTITASGANSRIKIAIEKSEVSKMLINNSLFVEMQIKNGKNYIVFPRSKDGQAISGAYNRVWKNEVGTIATQNPIKILCSKQEEIDKINKVENSELNGEFNKLPVFVIDNKQYVVRTLTERECWKLMGFTNQDFEKVLKANISKSGLYHLAGNSIVVPVLESIFQEILKLW